MESCGYVPTHVSTSFPFSQDTFQLPTVSICHEETEKSSGNLEDIFEHHVVIQKRHSKSQTIWRSEHAGLTLPKSINIYQHMPTHANMIQQVCCHPAAAAGLDSFTPRENDGERQCLSRLRALSGEFKEHFQVLPVLQGHRHGRVSVDWWQSRQSLKKLQQRHPMRE